MKWSSWRRRENGCGGQSEQVLVSYKFSFPLSFVDPGLDVWVWGGDSGSDGTGSISELGIKYFFTSFKANLLSKMRYKKCKIFRSSFRYSKKFHC